MGRVLRPTLPHYTLHLPILGIFAFLLSVFSTPLMRFFKSLPPSRVPSIPVWIVLTDSRVVYVCIACPPPEQFARRRNIR